jgi:hypothetical protein
MSNRHTLFAGELLQVMPVTRELVYSMLTDQWPSPAAVVDFGIDSQKHYAALQAPIREAEIMPVQLDQALGSGRRLTELVRASASNPHRDVGFHGLLDAYERLLDVKAGTCPTREPDAAVER